MSFWQRPLAEENTQHCVHELCMSCSKSTSPHLLSQASYLNNNHNREVKQAILQKRVVNYSVSLFHCGVNQHASLCGSHQRQQWKCPCLCWVLGLHCLSPSVHTACMKLKQMHCWLLSSSPLKSDNGSHPPITCIHGIPLVTLWRPSMPCYLQLIFVICHCPRCNEFFHSSLHRNGVTIRTRGSRWYSAEVFLSITLRAFWDWFFFFYWVGAFYFCPYCPGNSHSYAFYNKKKKICFAKELNSSIHSLWILESHYFLFPYLRVELTPHTGTWVFAYVRDRSINDQWLKTFARYGRGGVLCWSHLCTPCRERDEFLGM